MYSHIPGVRDSHSLWPLWDFYMVKPQDKGENKVVFSTAEIHDASYLAQSG